MSLEKELARKIRQNRQRAHKEHSLTGVIVSASGGTATVNIGGTEVPDVPYAAHCEGDLSADDVAILFWNGDSPAVIGRY